MKHFLRKDQVFIFNCFQVEKPKKYLVKANEYNINLTIEDRPKIITQYSTETKENGWMRQIKEQVDFTIRDPNIWDAQYKVIKVAMSGGSTGRDPYPDGHHITAQRVDGDETIGFYQSGCFTGMIDPNDVDLVSGPEDKEAKLKAVWVETTWVEECDHKYVMDGHNSGEPICSKCFKKNKQ